MTRSIILRLLTISCALAATAAPTASAAHWTYDSGGDWASIGGSICYTHGGDAACIAAYLCTGGAPPQAVDLVLYCAGRAAGEADDVALWVPVYAWAWADDLTRLAENEPSALNQQTAVERGVVNGVLCTTVWSFFCTNPIALPEHVPAADPIGPYPLA